MAHGETDGIDGGARSRWLGVSGRVAAALELRLEVAGTRLGIYEAAWLRRYGKGDVEEVDSWRRRR